MGFNCLKATEPLQGDSLFFLPISSQKFLVLIWSTLEGWKAESTLEPPSGIKVDSAFHPSEVNQMSTRNFWELSGKRYNKKGVEVGKSNTENTCVTYTILSI